ncbi:hypothetical protein ACPV5U_19240 [Vibrio mediterranei]
MSLPFEIKTLLLEWKEEEEHLAQLAKSRPEYRTQYLSQQTGMMRHRVSLEELLRKHDIHFPRTNVLDGEVEPDESNSIIEVND